jgi:hypothetical protein
MNKLNSPYNLGKIMRYGATTALLLAALTSCKTAIETPTQAELPISTPVSTAIISTAVIGCANADPDLTVWNPDTGERISPYRLPRGVQVEVRALPDPNIAKTVAGMITFDGAWVEPEDMIVIGFPLGGEYMVPRRLTFEEPTPEKPEGNYGNMIVKAGIDSKGGDNTDCALSKSDPDYQGDVVEVLNN